MPTFSPSTPAGFAITLLGELHKNGRISLADERVLRDVIMPVAIREHKELVNSHQQMIHEMMAQRSEFPDIDPLRLRCP